MERFVEQTSQAKIPNFDLPARGYHDVCRFQVTMENPVGMQVLASIQKLKHDAFHCAWRDGVPRWLGVVVDDLQEVMLGVLKYHEDAFIFQDDLNELDDIRVTQL